MAALQPTVGEFPTLEPNPKTFTEAVLSSGLLQQSSSSNSDLHLPKFSHVNPPKMAKLSTHKSLSSIPFTDFYTLTHSQPFSWTLIGKFTQGYNKRDLKLDRPSVEDLQKHFVAMDFKGFFQLGLMNNLHLLIQFQCEDDYLRMYSYLVCHIYDISMRIFKWFPYFRVHKKSLIVPLWISLPRLPIHLFREDTLFLIASLTGPPLRVNDTTSKLRRPSVARVQIELDVLLEHPEKIWIQMGNREYENVLPYCRYCWHIEYSEQLCHIHNPTLLNQHKPASKQVYVPIKPITSPFLAVPQTTSQLLLFASVSFPVPTSQLQPSTSQPPSQPPSN